MEVSLGNSTAVEGVIHPVTGVIEYRSLPGERTTTFTIEDSKSLADAFMIVVDGFIHHSQVGAPPVWIDSTSEPLTLLLEQHYRIPPGTRRPRDWGKES